MKQDYTKDPEEKNNSLVTFDARQLRTRLLVTWLNNIAMASASDDYRMWYQSLKTLYFICSPFVNESENDEVKKQLAKTKTVMNLFINKRNISQDIIESSFAKSTELVLSTYKDQFMMSSKEEGTEFKEDSFDGGSD